ncbi:Uncharacterised protein [Sphingobacterium multivorum]|uniref:Uncharacterized protein n=1 Tax=Sphingobacterium multivorum TaxID=28454 RepID=A0A2X2J8C2_SPHMU|nr:capsule assembly Wzi family protein [Sphingobacterium multivorum]SPZ88481.1 Uncharacterised protein [Sphingobacterium multivorum]
MGAEKKVYGSNYTLNDFQSLLYVMFGKAYGAPGVPKSKLGNQQGSIDMAFSYDWDNLQLMAYRQNFYDVGALSKLANIADGLNGITLTNRHFGRSLKNWDWHKFLVEFFTLKIRRDTLGQSQRNRAMKITTTITIINKDGLTKAKA